MASCMKASAKSLAWRFSFHRDCRKPISLPFPFRPPSLLNSYARFDFRLRACTRLALPRYAAACNVCSHPLLRWHPLSCPSALLSSQLPLPHLLRRSYFRVIRPHSAPPESILCSCCAWALIQTSVSRVHSTLTHVGAYPSRIAGFQRLSCLSLSRLGCTANYRIRFSSVTFFS